MPESMPCGKCGRGTMGPGKIRRFPGAVVVLGFLLIVGSILGLGFGAFAKSAGKWVAEEGRRSPAEIRQSLETAKVPETLIAKVMGESQDSPTAEELKALNPDQAKAVASAQIARVGQEIDPAAFETFAKTVLIVSAGGLILGWILRSKKPGLRCSNCGATAPIP